METANRDYENTNLKLKNEIAKENNNIKKQIIKKLKIGNINKINTSGANVEIESGQDDSIIKGLFEVYLPTIDIKDKTDEQLGNALYNLIQPTQVISRGLATGKSAKEGPRRKVDNRSNK